MSKFDSCVYSDYFAEYSMRKCRHPKNKGCIEAPCKGCILHETEKGNLENCPFCKSTKVSLVEEYGEKWHVHCSKCKANGPVKKDAREAKESWNVRNYKII